MTTLPRISLALLAGLALCLPASAADATLDVGDRAPALDQVTWIQGDAIPEFEAGKIYVLDFWATWCGPCIRSIPHLNELARDMADDDVTVVGVAIWPSPNMTPTDEFVADKGDEMAYPIAADIDGAMAEAYMKASGQNGIPTAMIIDREGAIAWIGHPMAGLDEVLEEVVAGTFDREAAKAKRAEEKAAEAAWMEARKEAAPLLDEFGVAMEGKEWQKAYDVATKISGMHEGFISFNLYRYQALVQMEGGAEKASALGHELTQNEFAEQAGLLNAFSWWIVDPDGSLESEQRDYDLALEAAQRADKLTEGKDSSIVDTLARVHFEMGAVAKAIEIQTRAVELAAGQDEAQASLRATLDSYKAAEQS